jgi:hypothetical protein
VLAQVVEQEQAHTRTLVVPVQEALEQELEAQAHTLKRVGLVLEVVGLGY